MPKFNLDINGVDQDAFEGFEVWSGPLPKPGVYEGKLKVCRIVVIDADGTRRSKNQGKNRVKIGVELVNAGDVTGYVAWGGVNLVESGIGFVNQFLKALTDGSEEEFVKIKKAFYEGGIRVDEKKEHIVAIGPWKIESPDGQLPIKISLSQRQRTITDDSGSTTVRTNVDIKSFLLRDGASSTAGGSDDEPAEEPDIVDVEAMDLDDNEDNAEVDESVFDAEPEPADAS